MSRINRSAIESELSSLYDAYYDELESYALHQQRYASLPPGTIPPPPGPGPFPGSVDPSTLPATPPADPNGAAAAKPQRGRVVKPTRDHKNVRPAALSHHKKKPSSQPNDPNSNPTGGAAAAAAVPPGHTHGHTHAHGPAGTNPGHGEPGHTHSTSCPHHPQQGTGAADSRQKNKAAVVHPEEPDEEDYDEDEDGEYDDEDEDGEDGEYDDDEEEEEEDDEEVRYLTCLLRPAPQFADLSIFLCSFPRARQYDDEDSLAPADEQPAPAKKSRRVTGEGDFFGFGKSLTVKEGILTVADELLQNNGQKFLEMMEQLADKRVRRDREAAEAFDDEQSGAEDRSDGGDYDDEDEGDEDDEADASDEEEEENDEPLTEQERVEEGRRMFQIFAARMFEQRVLTAFREQVSQRPAFRPHARVCGICNTLTDHLARVRLLPRSRTSSCAKSKPSSAPLKSASSRRRKKRRRRRTRRSESAPCFACACTASLC